MHSGRTRVSPGKRVSHAMHDHQLLTRSALRCSVFLTRLHGGWVCQPDRLTRCSTREPHQAKKEQQDFYPPFSFSISVRLPTWKKPGSDEEIRSPRMNPIRNEGVG